MNSKSNTASLDNNLIQEFRNALRGELILPADDSYDEARKVYNAMIDKRPGMIAVCNDVADVILAVNFGYTTTMLVGPAAYLAAAVMAEDLS